MKSTINSGWVLFESFHELANDFHKKAKQTTLIILVLFCSILKKQIIVAMNFQGCKAKRGNRNKSSIQLKK